METKYDIDKVTHIKIYEQEPVSLQKVIWKPLRSYFFGLITYKEGWYFEYHWDNYRFGEYDGDLENTINIDGELFNKPFINIFINRENVDKKFFETIDELNHFVETHFPNVKNFIND